MRRTGQVLAALGAVVAFASAFMHGFMARRAVLGRLAGDVAPETIAGLNAAWMLGTASLVAFGALVLLCVPSLGREPSSNRVTLAAGAFFLGYGAWAYVYRHFHPHFIGIMVVGVLFIAGSAIASRARARN